LWAGIYNVIFAFRAGAAVILMERFDTQAFAGFVERFQLRSTVLPPAAMTMLADDESIDTLAPLKYVRSITAPLSPLQARRFRDRFGVMVLNGWGQTEIGGEIVGWAHRTPRTGDTHRRWAARTRTCGCASATPGRSWSDADDRRAQRSRRRHGRPPVDGGSTPVTRSHRPRGFRDRGSRPDMINRSPKVFLEEVAGSCACRPTSPSVRAGIPTTAR
jgi:acyl-coenzyme A synthetase/AMP-(fatty) acid ligase